MSAIYFARKYTIYDEKNRHFYEEGIFHSYELAYKYIKKISDEEDHDFFGEIVVFELNDFSRKLENEFFIFDYKANLIYDSNKINSKIKKYIAEENGFRTIYKINDPNSYNEKFKIGDIVFIKAFPWNIFSPAYVDLIGVIGNVPCLYEKWIQNNNYYEWDNTYVIYCIRDGYLGHWHIEERGIEFYSGELPDNLKFLRLLSEHLLKKMTIPDIIIDKIHQGEVFVEKLKYYLFSLLSKNGNQ